MTGFGDDLKIMFLDEATTHLEKCESCFLNLDKQRHDAATIEQIFRLAHNLKGAALCVGWGHIADFCHEMESLLLKFRNKELEVRDESVTLLLECNDYLRMVIGVLRSDLNAKIENEPLVERLKSHGPVTNIAPQKVESSAAVPPRAPAPAPAPAPKSANAPAAATASATGAKTLGDETIRVSLDRLEKLNDLVGELVILQTILTQSTHQLQSASLQKTVGQLAKITREIQSVSMACRMIPLHSTFQKLQRVCRDTAIGLGKLVDFEISGEDTEVDRTVIEYLSDPLMHIVRNAVDHGLEDTEERTRQGKTERGQIQVHAYQKGSQLIVEIRDDGRGIDPALVQRRAVENNLIAKDVELSADAIHQLLFLPGFSTKTEVTEISGRGVGLDVVSKNIQRLSGEIEIESEKGRGTTFRVHFPLTLAIIEAMVVRLGSERFVVPLSQVHETVRTTVAEINDITGKGQVLNLRGETLPLYTLHRLLKYQQHHEAPKNSLALVVRGQKHAFAIVVDDILRQQQVVMKQIGSEVRNRRGFLGSAILYDGQPALVLDLHDLIKPQSEAPNLREAM